MTRIEPYNLWIGHVGDARDFPRIAEMGIEALVHLAAEDSCGMAPRELLYLRFPLTDGIGNRTDWLELAIRAVASLIRFETPTLVCCGAGMSRAPTIVAAALALESGETPEECLRAVTAHHPADVAPGSGMRSRWCWTE